MFGMNVSAVGVGVKVGANGVGEGPMGVGVMISATLNRHRIDSAGAWVSSPTHIAWTFHGPVRSGVNWSL